METHDTEVEEIVKEFYKIFDTNNLWQGEDEWTKNVPIGNLEQWLRTTLRYRLQKAREEEAEACAIVIWNYLATFEDCLEPTQRTNALNHAIKLIRKRKDHSELDQDKK